MAATQDGRVLRLMDEAKVFMSITGPGKDVMKAVFQAFYSSPQMDSNNGKMTLKEYTQDKKLSNKTFQNIFHGMEVASIMDEDLIRADLDITFYYAVITKLSSNAYANLNTNSQVILKELKTQRNLLAHNGDFLVQPLPEKLKYLEELYIDVLDVFDQEFPGSPYLQDARVSVPSLNARIRNEPIDIDQYLQDREKFNEQLQNWIVCEGQGELASNKQFGNSTDPFQKLLELRSISQCHAHPIEKVFTSPWIKHGQRKQDLESLLEVRDRHGELPRVIFMAGLGGSGKSTLIHKIFTEWQNRGNCPRGLKCLDTFDFIFYVELKYTCSNSLRELLETELLVETLQKAKWNDVFPILNDLNLLFLVDGFDEVKEEGKKLVREIARLLPSSRVLLTTRPEFLKEAQNIFLNSSSVELNLRGFDRSNQETFAGNVLQLTEQDSTVANLLHVKFCDFLDRRGMVLKSHLELPLTMALLIFLWIESRDSPEKLETIDTATQLYRELFQMLKEKLVRVRNWFAAVSEDALDRVLHCLQGAALEQLSLNILLQLSDESYTSIKDRCSENDLSEDDTQREFLSAFLVYDPDVLVRTKKKAVNLKPKPPYSFFHRTQMEYFGAEHAVGELASKKLASLNECLTSSETRRYKEVLPFVAGCLSNQGILKLHCEELISLSHKADVQNSDFNFWFKLISETSRRDRTLGDTSFSEELCSKIVDILPKRPWKLDTETLISGLSLLIHCKSVQVTELEIDCQINEDPNNVTGLDAILKEAAAVLGKKFGSRKVNLSLHFRDHIMPYSNGRSDSFLQYFGTWTKLIHFTGHVGAAATRLLSACKHIEVKLSCLEDFNAFMRLCKSNRNLKRLTIIAGFVDSYEEKQVRPIPPECGSEFRILFHGVDHNSLDRVISFVDRSTGRRSSFDRLGVHSSSLRYSDGVRLFASLQNLVTGKVTVESTEHLTGEQEEGIMRDALAGKNRPSTFQAEWNSFPV